MTYIHSYEFICHMLMKGVLHHLIQLICSLIFFHNSKLYVIFCVRNVDNLISDFLLLIESDFYIKQIHLYLNRTNTYDFSSELSFYDRCVDNI